MKLPFFDTALWAAGPAFNAALIGILFLRRRARTFPVLTAWCAFTIFSACVAFFVYRSGSQHAYAITYWSSEVIDAVLQVGVVSEVAGIVFRPVKEWSRKSRIRIGLFAIAGLTGAFLIIQGIHPAALTHAGVWEIRGELFTSLIISEMFVWVLIASQSVGLHWRSHVMSVGYGLMVWAVAVILIGLLHGYWGRYSHYTQIEHGRMLVYLAILTYWMVALWRDEPKRVLATPEMRESLLQVTSKVSYDLAKALDPGKDFR